MDDYVQLLASAQLMRLDRAHIELADAGTYVMHDPSYLINEWRRTNYRSRLRKHREPHQLASSAPSVAA